MGSNLQTVSGQQHTNGTYTVTTADPSADQKTASVARVTAKTQRDTFDQARRDSQPSLTGSLSLPLVSPNDALVAETVETATKDASGAIHAGADNASYAPGSKKLSGVHPQERRPPHPCPGHSPTSTTAYTSSWAGRQTRTSAISPPRSTASSGGNTARRGRL